MFIWYIDSRATHIIWLHSRALRLLISRTSGNVAADTLLLKHLILKGIKALISSCVSPSRACVYFIDFEAAVDFVRSIVSEPCLLTSSLPLGGLFTEPKSCSTGSNPGQAIWSLQIGCLAIGLQFQWFQSRLLFELAFNLIWYSLPSQLMIFWTSWRTLTLHQERQLRRLLITCKVTVTPGHKVTRKDDDPMGSAGAARNTKGVFQ